ncbi:hypothetical protein GCM10009624_24660 [Gordonia sinesedis]
MPSADVLPTEDDAPTRMMPPVRDDPTADAPTTTISPVRDVEGGPGRGVDDAPTRTIPPVTDAASDDDAPTRMMAPVPDDAVDEGRESRLARRPKGAPPLPEPDDDDDVDGDGLAGDTGKSTSALTCARIGKARSAGRRRPTAGEVARARGVRLRRPGVTRRTVAGDDVSADADDLDVTGDDQHIDAVESGAGANAAGDRDAGDDSTNSHDSDARDEIVTGPSPEWKRRRPGTRVTRVKNVTMRSSVKWVAVAACLVVAVAAGIGAWAVMSRTPDSGAAAAVRSFADALSRKDAGGAAEMTTAPGQAGEALTQTLQAMNADSIDVAVERPVEYSDGTASFSLRTTWRWDKDRTFEATSSGSARHLTTGWKVTWEPSVIYPGLPVGGMLREIRTDATPAPTVRSRSGRTFMYLQPVNEIILDPNQTRDVGNSVRRLAKTLAPIAPLVTSDVLSQKLAATPGKPITAVTLRNSDMEVLTSNPNSVPGVSVRKAGMLVMADRRLSSPLESGLTNYWQAIRDATAGWQVQMVGPGMKPRRLAGEQGPAGPDVRTTVDQNVQLTLGDAAVEVGQPATIVALDAGSGAILGMAQNSYAINRGINADATYPVGTTLDPVFRAVDRAANANQESTDAILDRFGLGVQFTVPGASAPTPGQPGVATIDFRPGVGNASIMNMAALGVALARSDDGVMKSVAPHVISGVPTKVAGGSLGDLDKGVSTSVLQAMTSTAKSGDASDLTRAPGLKALVGTNGPQGPGWFIGIQGGKVIVIYTEGEKSGTAALQVAQKYFGIR